MSWESEHGEDYEVPPEIDNHPDLLDASYKNDSCPAFDVSGTGDMQYTIWIDHPDPGAREGGYSRFGVTVFNEHTMGEPETILETDDLGQLLAFLKKNIPKWQKLG